LLQSPAKKIINDCHQAVAEGLLMIETVDAFLARLKQRDPHQPEFHQAVEEVVRSLWPFLEAHPHYMQAGII